MKTLGPKRPMYLFLCAIGQTLNDCSPLILRYIAMSLYDIIDMLSVVPFSTQILTQSQKRSLIYTQHTSFFTSRSET